MIPDGCPSSPHWHVSGKGHGICTKCLPAKSCETDFINNLYKLSREEMDKLRYKKDHRKKEKEMVMPIARVAGETESPIIIKADTLTDESLVPPKPIGIAAMKGYYDQNKEAILRDYEKLGSAKMKKRWGIADGTFTGLCRRWGVQRRGYNQKKRVIPPVSQELSKPEEKLTEMLPVPSLPAWDEIKTHADAVKVKWLEVVADLMVLEK